MAIVYFDNFKFDNSGGAISPLTWNTFAAAGTRNVTSTYPNNGYSSSGLDLSITSSSATHGSYYAQKTGIALSTTSMPSDPGSTGGIFSGMVFTQYKQSGGLTQEPPLLSDMSKYTNTVSNCVAVSGDGQQVATLRFDGTSSTILEFYNRNSTDSNQYTLSGTTFTFSSTTNSGNHGLQFSKDGLYLGVMLPVSGTNNFFVYRRTPGNPSTYTNVGTFNTGIGVQTGFVWLGGNCFAVSGSTTPFIKFYFKTFGTDTWTAASNPSTLPTSAATGIAAFGSSVLVTINATTNPIFRYTFTSTAAPIFSSTPLTLPAAATCVDMAPGFNIIAVGMASSPYVSLYNLAGTNLGTLPVSPNTAVFGVKFSPDSSYLYVGTGNGSTATIFVYKYYSATQTFVNVSSSLVGLQSGSNKLNFSADNNYMVYPTSSTNGYIATFDQQINVPFVISQSAIDPSLMADNYGYSSGPSRISLTVQDEFLGLRVFNSATGSVMVCPLSSPLSQVGLDNTFTNAYMEVNAVESNSSTSLTMNNRIQGSTIGGSLVGTNTTSPANTWIDGISAMNQLFTGPISIMFKRDINTSTATTINCAVSDFYLNDRSSVYNNTVIGPTSVVVEPLTADVSKQWSSTTGTTSYQILNNNPPNSDHVFTNVLNNTDIMSVDTTNFDSTVFASKLQAKAKLENNTANGLVLIDGMYQGSKQSLNTSYNDIEYYSDSNSTYVAISNNNNASAPSGFVYKFNTKASNTAAALQTLSVSNMPTGISNGIALSANANHFALATASSPFIQVYKNTNDTFTQINGLDFSAITSAILGTTGHGLAYSPDGRYLAAIFDTKLIVYKIVGDTYTLLTTFTLTNAANSIKFSKGSKYLFLGSSVNGTSQVYSVNSGTDTFTALSSTSVTTNIYKYIDTMLTLDGLVEWVVMANTASPFLYMYKINNDDTFTAVTVTSQSQSNTISGVVIPRVLSTSATIPVYITTANSGLTMWLANYTVSTNTLGSMASLGTQPGPANGVASQACARIGSSYSIILATGTSSGVYVSYGSAIISATNVWTSIAVPYTFALSPQLSTVETYYSPSQVGYKYSP